MPERFDICEECGHTYRWHFSSVRKNQPCRECNCVKFTPKK